MTRGGSPRADALSDPILHDDVLRAWSMAGFQGTVLEAHDHFFATFGKFGAVLSDARTGDAIADVVSTAGRNRLLYVELMQGLNSSTVGSVASRYIAPGDPWDEDFLLAARIQIIADPVFSETLETTKASLLVLRRRNVRTRRAASFQPARSRATPRAHLAPCG